MPGFAPVEDVGAGVTLKQKDGTPKVSSARENDELSSERKTSKLRRGVSGIAAHLELNPRDRIGYMDDRITPVISFFLPPLGPLLLFRFVGGRRGGGGLLRLGDGWLNELNERGRKRDGQSI